MLKHEPSPKVKFTVKGPHDSSLAALAAITNRSRLRGPWDQARIWIYTDKATFDQINKRLRPQIDAGRYVMLLRDNGRNAGVDFSQKGYSDCLDPAVLPQGACVDEKAVRWVVSAMADIKPKDLEKLVSGQFPKFLDLVAADPTDGPRHIAWIASSMLESGDESLQKAACKLLLAMPQGAMSIVARAGALESLRALFSGLKEDRCKLALDVAEAYGDGATKQMVMSFVERLPSEALKARAAKIAGVPR